MADVIDIKTKKRTKAKKPAVKDATLAQAEEAVGPFAQMVLRRLEKEEKGILDFDWDEFVTRIEVTPGVDKDDVLDYTIAGRKKFTEIFIGTFGFPRLPTTYGELWAMYSYCGTMDDLARHPRGTVMMAENWPDHLPVFLAYKKGDIFTLRREHTEELIAELTEDAWKD